MAFFKGSIVGPFKNPTSVIAGDISIEGNIYAASFTEPENKNLYMFENKSSIADRLVKLIGPAMGEKGAITNSVISETIEKAISKNTIKFLRKQDLLKITGDTISTLNYSINCSNINFLEVDLQLNKLNVLNLNYLNIEKCASEINLSDSEPLVSLYGVSSLEKVPSGAYYIEINNYFYFYNLNRTSQELEPLGDYMCYPSSLGDLQKQKG